jgi:hypothetical protein
MSGLIETLTATIARVRKGLAGHTQALDARLDRIRAEHHAWFQREQQRVGATISGAAPEPVQEAVAKVTRERQTIVKRYFDRADEEIRRDRGELVQVLSEHAQALIEGWRVLAEFDKQYRAFAAECGESRPYPPDFMPVIDELRGFIDREQRRAAGPKVWPAYQPQATNPITVAQ